MAEIVRWETTGRKEWSYQREKRNTHYLVYKLSSLPDFSEPRFEYLGRETEARLSAVIGRQQLMLRQLHGLGSDWGISLRLRRHDHLITLYLIFRWSGNSEVSENIIGPAKEMIENALLTKEYSFSYVNDPSEEFGLTDISWARSFANITRYEAVYSGDTYPDGRHMTYYVPFAWIPAENTMEHLCESLLMQNGDAAAEVVLVPTRYLEEEKQWLNSNIAHLRDSVNGETIKNEDGRTLWQGKPLPGLRIPLDNCEKMQKQFETTRMFLIEARVYSAGDAGVLSNAFLTNSVRDKGSVQVLEQADPLFPAALAGYRNVDIIPEIQPDLWRGKSGKGFRPQRFPRMASLEEVSAFFRLPIPVRPGFPGFGYDTGIAGGASSSGRRTGRQIRIGTYQDGTESRSGEPASFDVQQLAKHGLVVGVPGSGKTTAMFNLLYQLWDAPEDERIPFIVLEPAKTEYRALKTLDIFKDDMLVFTLGDESISAFRFNPMEVMPGIRLESHISKLQACFVGAFNLFDPLPIFLEQAIRRTYQEKGWYEDSRGGEDGLETPTLSDLARNAEYIVSHSGFDEKMKSDFQASLLERLNSLRRGSKGRMLDTKISVPPDELMKKPVILELDSLNGDEKALVMMFLLTYVFEYCKANRRSGSPLKHVMLVEEAHNLISSYGNSSELRADAKGQTIELFVNMLAEMRALGQGIMIADQLPTAIAPQAVKQTNMKLLMRITSKDDREEIGSTMGLNEEQMQRVINFKTGFAFLYHEGEDRVRMIRMLNFKGEHQIEEPPMDSELKDMMAPFEEQYSSLYMPYKECSGICSKCERRVRNQAESFVRRSMTDPGADPWNAINIPELREKLSVTQVMMSNTMNELRRIEDRYGKVGSCFGGCVYVHMLNMASGMYPSILKNKQNVYLNEEELKENIRKFMDLKPKNRS